MVEVPLRITIQAKAEHTYLYLVRTSGWQDGFACMAQCFEGKWRCESLDGGDVSHEMIKVLGLLVDAGLVDTEEAEGDAKLARWLWENAVLPTVKEEKKVKPCPECGGGVGGLSCNRCGGCGVVTLEEEE